MLHSKELNVFEEEDDSSVCVTGIESAINALSVSKMTPDAHPERRRKALFKVFVPTNALFECINYFLFCLINSLLLTPLTFPHPLHYMPYSIPNRHSRIESYRK